MQVLTNYEGEKAIYVDQFEETVRLTPRYPISVTHLDGTINFYLLGEARQYGGGLIVPLQPVPEAEEAEARRIGTIAHFAEDEEGGVFRFAVPPKK